MAASGARLLQTRERRVEARRIRQAAAGCRGKSANAEAGTLEHSMAARCFVIMPFDPAYDDIFEYGIRRALAKRGIESFRMDQVPGSINLIEQMIRHLCEADLIVADLTGANANVLYELGVAHAAGASRQAVLIAENGSEVPFDLAPYKVVYYDRSFRGIENLSDHLLREIDAIEQGNVAANPVLDYLSRKA